MVETLEKKTLFWDACNLNPVKDGHFIIGRILNFGNEDDFRWAMRFYGAEKIKQSLKSNRQLHKKSLSFWCQYFNIDTSQCIATQSANQRGAFWQK